MEATPVAQSCATASAGSAPIMDEPRLQASAAAVSDVKNRGTTDRAPPLVAGRQFSLMALFWLTNIAALNCVVAMALDTYDPLFWIVFWIHAALPPLLTRWTLRRLGYMTVARNDRDGEESGYALVALFAFLPGAMVGIVLCSIYVYAGFDNDALFACIPGTGVGFVAATWTFLRHGP